MKKLLKSDDEWKKILTKQQFDILRLKGTEPPFTGDLLDLKDKGTYSCIACNNPLFRSSTKFDSGTGWPSFFEPINKSVILLNKNQLDGSEVLCYKCEGHLGHVFTDGPKPTGLRYCMNSAVLKFTKSKEE